MYAEGWSSRQMPLLIGQLALIGSQILLMLAPNYPLMCIARVFQGISSSVIWVVGLALLYVIISISSCGSVERHPGVTLPRSTRLAVSLFQVLVGLPIMLLCRATRDRNDRVVIWVRFIS